MFSRKSVLDISRLIIQASPYGVVSFHIEWQRVIQQGQADEHRICRSAHRRVQLLYLSRRRHGVDERQGDLHLPVPACALHSLRGQVRWFAVQRLCRWVPKVDLSLYEPSDFE